MSLFSRLFGPAWILALSVLGPSLSVQAVEAAPKGLSGPYIDPSYFTKIPFPSHSHWLQPWRAYQDTVPAAAFLNGLGIHVDMFSFSPQDTPLAVEMLAKYGMKQARLELSWDHFTWEDDKKLDPGFEGLFAAWLKNCRARGIRPLIVLNSHHGAPCPTLHFTKTLAEDAAKGARALKFKDAKDLVPGRSGIHNDKENISAEILFTEVNGTTCALSKPLPESLKAGAVLKLDTLKFRPFGVPGIADTKETLKAWKAYVAACGANTARILGTSQAADKGFDMEIWNEMSFGNNFLYINRYYEPALASYNEDAVMGALVQATVEVLESNPEAYSGVELENGFSNTLPQPASSRQPARVGYLGKHPYPQPGTYPSGERPNPKINAKGKADRYAPKYSQLFPEYFATAIQDGSVVCDIGPINNDVGGTTHGRFARPGGPVGVWFTDIGLKPLEYWVKDPKLALPLKAKTTSRFFAFYLNKGAGRVYLYAAAGDGDNSYGVLQGNFMKYIQTASAYPVDDASYTSPCLAVTGRMAAVMRDQLDPGLKTCRPLKVEEISDTHNHFQFEGDGSEEHPSLYDREVFAFLPYQVNARRFVIPYYVMTRDVRKNMAVEQFNVKISGIATEKTTFTAYDPIYNRSIPVAVKSKAGNTVELALWATDYPYMLVVQE